VEPENAGTEFWPGAETPDLGLLERRSMSQSTLPTNEAVAVSTANERNRTRPLGSVHRTVREILLEDDLPDFEVYQVLCEFSIPSSITDLERMDG
jgi:hypothetical protein